MTSDVVERKKSYTGNSVHRNIGGVSALRVLVVLLPCADSQKKNSLHRAAPSALRRSFERDSDSEVLLLGEALLRKDHQAEKIGSEGSFVPE